jgi:uncharacterized protein (DUF433 family)
MVLTIEASPVPLTISNKGVISITGTRVTLDTVIHAFEEGATAEEIALRYPTLRLVDIYAVITYYLNHQVEVKAYLKQERELDDKMRLENETRHDMSGIRERLLARRVAQERQS